MATSVVNSTKREVYLGYSVVILPRVLLRCRDQLVVMVW
jgi:hypothetical protein